MGSTLYKVSAGTSVKSLGSSIARELYCGNVVDVRAVGAGAVNQAVKSIAVAGRFVEERGLHLGCAPFFRTMDGGLTVIEFRVRAVEEAIVPIEPRQTPVP
jgi:stage V sporulation protein S